MLKAGTEIKSKSEVYIVDKYLTSGDFCDLYEAHTPSAKRILKITKLSADNDLLKNEAAILTYLQNNKGTKDLKTNKHIIKFFDTFEVDDRQVNILQAFDYRYVSLADVIKANPKGIDVRDAVWMFNRILGALTIPHQAGVIHGAIVPTNFMICPEPRSCPEAHNGVLIDWSYAAKQKIEEDKKPKVEKVKNGLINFLNKTSTIDLSTKDVIDAICPDYENFYPPEIWDKPPATFGIDIYMAAKTFYALMGENEIPRKIKDLLQVCLLKSDERMSDVFEVFSEFERILESEFGKRKFSEFKI